MKKLMVFAAAGMVFLSAATFSGAVYWFAPINPCSITEPGQSYGFGGYTPPSHRDSLCSGDEIHSYQYGGRQIRARNGDIDFFVKLALVGFPLGAGVLTLLLGDTMRRRSERKKWLAEQRAAQVAA